LNSVPIATRGGRCFGVLQFENKVVRNRQRSSTVREENMMCVLKQEGV